MTLLIYLFVLLAAMILVNVLLMRQVKHDKRRERLEREARRHDGNTPAGS